MQSNKKNLSKRMAGREYEGMIPELVYIGTKLCGFYSDQLLPITNKYTTTAEIMSDTAKAFYKAFLKNIETMQYDDQSYHNILQEFAMEYVKQKYDIQLKRFNDSAIGEGIC